MSLQIKMLLLFPFYDFKTMFVILLLYNIITIVLNSCFNKIYNNH